MTEVNNSYIYTPGFPTYPNYQTYWYGPRTTKTVTVEKFYDEKGRLIREVTTTVETPYYQYAQGGYINTHQTNTNTATIKITDSTSVVESKSGKHRKKD